MAGPGAINAQHLSAERDITIVQGTLIQQLTIAHFSPLHQLPPVPAAFTGRDEDLDELERQLTGDNPAGATISGKHIGLQGLGGVGKTALATVLAHRLKERYPDAQLIINLRGTDPDKRAMLAPLEAMQTIVRCFHPETPFPKTVEELAPIYRSALTVAGRVLLLLDNAADAEQVRTLMPPPGCMLIVTSRSQFSLPGLVTHNIECLSPKRSQELLLRLAPRLDGYAEEAAMLCANLPLALEVFAGAVNDRTLYPVDTLLARLRAGKDKLPSVEAVFQVSCDLLTVELRCSWTQLSIFGASFDLRAAAAVWATDAANEEQGLSNALDTMQALVNASLVEHNKSNGRLRLHDLVRQFCANRLSESDRIAALSRHARHYCAVARESQVLYRKPGNMLRGLEQFDRERTHIENAFEWLQSRCDRESAALLISLVDAITGASGLRFHPRQEIRWREAQRNVASEIGDRAGEGRALCSLGLAYAALGDARKAIEFHDQALAIARETGDRSSEGGDLCNLGSAYYSLGDVRKAIELCEQAVTIDRAVGNRRFEANALSNLGNAFHSLGDARKAAEFYEQALAIAREIGDRRKEGGNLCSLGNVHYFLGDARKAIEYYEQYLSIAREFGDRRGEGAALGNLGSAYHFLGDARKAIECFDQYLTITREMGARDHEGSVLDNLGTAYSTLGDVRKAVKFHEQALAIAREIGDRHGEARALESLAGAHGGPRELRSRIEYGEQSLMIFREISDRRGEGYALGILGSAQCSLGNPRKAIEFYEQQLAIVREIGARHSECNALGSLGNAYFELGDERKAIEFHEQALVIAREIGNLDGEGGILCNLGLAYAALGDKRKAIEFYEQAVTIDRAVGNRRFEANALSNLGNAHSELGDERKAIEFYEKVLTIARETANRDGERSALNNLGLSYAALGYPTKAIEFHERALIVARDIGDRRGEGNSLWNSALSFEKLGDRAQAILRAEAALMIREEIKSPYAGTVRAKLAEWRNA